MVEGHNSFLRFDLAITREMHEANTANGVYPTLDPELDPVLTIRPEPQPTFEDLQYILEKVGGPYGWDRRQEFHSAPSVKAISEKLAQPTSKRFSFWAANKEVGGVIIANVETEADLRKIFKITQDASDHIDLSPSDAKKTMEIYKIGLFPEYTKRGWGKHFLQRVFNELFEGPEKPKVVYLNTRDTNHTGVVKFYRDVNMNVIHAQSHRNDLIDLPPQYRRISDRAADPSPTSAVA